MDATGDLAHKKIFPALYAMLAKGTLNEPVIGIATATGRSTSCSHGCATASPVRWVPSTRRSSPSSHCYSNTSAATTQDLGMLVLLAVLNQTRAVSGARLFRQVVPQADDGPGSS
ncbi:MAG: hypothetical protein ACK4QP_24700 [Pseudorhizobium sp.]